MISQLFFVILEGWRFVLSRENGIHYFFSFFKDVFRRRVKIDSIRDQSSLILIRKHSSDRKK